MEIRNNWQVSHIQFKTEAQFWKWLQREGQPGMRYKIFRGEQIGDFDSRENGCVLMDNND